MINAHGGLDEFTVVCRGHRFALCKYKERMKTINYLLQFQQLITVPQQAIISSPPLARQVHNTNSVGKYLFKVSRSGDQISLNDMCSFSLSISEIVHPVRSPSTPTGLAKVLVLKVLN